MKFLRDLVRRLIGQALLSNDERLAQQEARIERLEAAWRAVQHDAALIHEYERTQAQRRAT